MNPIEEYWEQIDSGAVIVSEKVRKAYQRLIQDIHDPNEEYEYIDRRARHAIHFIESFCRHSKGKLGGKPLLLELWEKALISAMFGFVHKIDGTRRFREVILIVARKNGKSTLAAAIGLYLMVADQEPGAEIYAVATKKDQAKIIWLEAKRMVKKSPVLLRKIKTLVGEMNSDFNESIFRPLGSDSDTQDGLNVHGALLDEVHAWKDKNLYDVIVDGETAREQPLTFISTTAGTVRESVYDIKYDEATNIINGYFDETGYQDRRTLPVIYELDSRSEWTNPDCWQKANPGLGTIKSLEQLADKVKKAQKTPLLVKNLLCKDFNIRETVGEAWLTFEQLNNPATFDIAALSPSYAIGGADLSSTTDLTCATALFKVPGDEILYILQMYWIPEDLLEERVREDKIPYDLWRDAGWLRAVPGNKIHPKHVTEWFKEIRDEYGIYLFQCGYDAWAAEYWVDEMQGEFGEVMEKVWQGKKTLSAPMKSLGADLGAKKINYNNNPILKWCMSNVAIETDKNLNIQPCKTHNQRRRIDGFASLLNAYVELERHLEDYNNLIGG